MSSGPPGWPVIGHLPAFLSHKLGFLTLCAERYGDIVPPRIGEPTFLLNDPAAIKHVLVDNIGNYSKTWRLTNPRGKRLSGNGLHTSFGVEHLRQRRMWKPVFSRTAGDELFFEVMVHRIGRRMEDWAKREKSRRAGGNRAIQPRRALVRRPPRTGTPLETAPDGSRIPRYSGPIGPRCMARSLDAKRPPQSVSFFS